MAGLKRGEVEKRAKSKFFVWMARIFDLGKIVIILAMVIYLAYLFVASIFTVSGASMEPNFYEREYLLVNKLNTILDQPKRGDVVVFKFPGELEEKYIKRIIGLPGETVEVKNEEVYINGKKLIEGYLAKDLATSQLSAQNKWTLQNGEFFVLGDNRLNSNDSRVWGSLPKEYLIGKISYVVFPFSQIGTIESANYYTGLK